MNEPILKINGLDNVAVLLQSVPKGFSFTVDGRQITALSDMDKGHKIALQDIKKGEHVIKYAHPIGHAICDIPVGSHVHTHNIKTNLKGLLDYTYTPSEVPVVSSKQATFMGYKREDGRVGIRNEIWIINTVGCVNKISERLAQTASNLYKERVDGIYAFTHPYGCSQLGEDHETTRKILAGLVNHPNAAGVLVLGLGCENNTISSFRALLESMNQGINQDRIKFLVTQEVEDELESGLSLIHELVEYAERFKRQPCPVSSLVIGLKCGGSDAFSGVTANPLVGSLSDHIISHGGSTLLTEVPEMFGAETILMNRCTNKEIFHNTVNLINHFKEYYIRHHQVVYENPSPGNKAGGITTLEEKSLGCIYKGGTSQVVNVLALGHSVTNKGLNLLDGPGNDIVAVTNLTASGAHIILFTTGRGTPLGAPVPTVKISSNTDLSIKKPNWIDYNAGRLLEGASMDTLTQDLFDFLMKVASGETTTKNEENNYREIAIFKDGVTL